MAFTTRSKRDTSLSVSSVPATVGPGSYFSDKPFVTSPKYSVAPFSSTSKREFGPPAAATYANTPGPGSHYADEDGFAVRKSSVAASAFKSKSSRLIDQVQSDVKVGPGAYTLPDQWAPKPRAVDVAPEPHTHLKWVKVPSVPSVPARHQCFGYEEGPTGELVPQSPPRDKGHTGVGVDKPGPGEYDVRKSGARNAHGPSFAPHRHSVSRNRSPDAVARNPSDLSVGSFGPGQNRRAVKVLMRQTSPGPGSYDPPTKITAGNLDALRPSAAFALPATHAIGAESEDKTSTSGARTSQPAKGSTLAKSGGASVRPRSASAATRKHVADGPGPGAYNLPGAFRVQHKPEHMQFFGSTMARDTMSLFVDQDHLALPGPGSYIGNSTSGTSASGVPGARSSSQKTSFQRPGIGFASGSERFAEKRSRRVVEDPSGELYAEEEVGPGAHYNPDTMSMAGEVHRKMHGRFGAFGSTAARFEDKDALAKAEVSALHGGQILSMGSPAPGSYDPQPDVHPDQIRVRNRKSAVFASKSKRDTYAEMVKRASEVPPPGAYTVPSTFASGDPAGSYNVFASVNGGAVGAFSSTSPRFGPEVLREMKEASRRPGPGSYEPKADFDKPVHKAPEHGGFETSQTRFASVRNETVSPEVGPGVHHHDLPWVRKSYNVTIEKPAFYEPKR